MGLTVATCQFPVGPRPRENAAWIARLMRRAKEGGADVAHFGECALSGYAGVDLPDYEGFDWEEQRDCARGLMVLADELGLHALIGAAHPLSGRKKPHNSVYVIDDRGRLVDRYDKRFCAGGRDGRTGELAHFTPGDHASVFRIGGVLCGVLICHEYRYPELFRELARRGVAAIFHSFHAAGVDPARLASMRAEVGAENLRFNRGTTLPEITMPATLQGVAASNHVFLSAANSSRRESCWPAFFVRADGVITGALRKHRAGVLITTIDPGAALYDSTAAWRGRAMRGILHSGRLVADPRSRARRRL